MTRLGDVSAVNVGKGHWTFGANGALYANTGGFTSLGLNLGANVGYFVADPVLVGAALSFGTATTTGAGATANAQFQVAASASYWVPFTSTAFGFAGAEAGVGPYFSAGGTTVSWHAGPYLGAALFVTPWLALTPRLNVNFPGPDVSLTFGLSWYL